MKYPFLFSSSERRGLYLLLLLSALFIVGKYFFFPAQSVSLEKAVALQKKDTVFPKIYPKKEWKVYEKKKYTSNFSSDYTTPKSVYSKPKIEPIELNSATAEQLVLLNGIGESYASRIIKYREILGGYVAKEQLLQVYGLGSALYDKIKNDVLVNSALVKKYNINTDSEEELAKCRRIGFKRAKVLVNYRKQHGDFSSVKDLLKTRVFSDSLLYLIEPYILLQ
ncbi:MAG: ComEA family DNA-binding protein [Flavobacteriales bacterium]